MAENQFPSTVDALFKGMDNFITTKTGGTGDTIIKLNPYLIQTITDWFGKNL